MSIWQGEDGKVLLNFRGGQMSITLEAWEAIELRDELYTFPIKVPEPPDEDAEDLRDRIERVNESLKSALPRLGASGCVAPGPDPRCSRAGQTNRRGCVARLRLGRRPKGLAR